MNQEITRVERIHPEMFKHFSVLNIWDTLRWAKLTAMVGPSSYGKSSVIRCYKLFGIWMKVGKYGGL